MPHASGDVPKPRPDRPLTRGIVRSSVDCRREAGKAATVGHGLRFHVAEGAMKRILGYLVLACVTGLAARVAASDDRWIHVRVDDADGGGGRVDIQVADRDGLAACCPRSRASTAAARYKWTIHRRRRRELRGYWNAVRTAKDGEYVTVQRRGLRRADLEERRLSPPDRRRQGRRRPRPHEDSACRSSTPRSPAETRSTLEAIGKALANAPMGELSPSTTTTATFGSGSTRSQRPRARTGDEIGERLALAVILGLGVVACGTAGAAAYAWQRAGNVRIAIHENRPGGDDLSLSLPGLLVNAAIALCPVPADAEFHARLHDMAPALREVAMRLDAMPDAVLVDAEVRRRHGPHRETRGASS